MGAAGEFLENECEQHHKRHKAQHHQRHRIVDKQHGNQNAGNDHYILDHGHQHTGEHPADAVRIVGNTGNQLANGDVVQLLVGKAFNVSKHILTQIRQDLLTDLLQDHCLQVHADHRHHQHTGIGANHPVELAQWERVFDQILDISHQNR